MMVFPCNSRPMAVTKAVKGRFDMYATKLNALQHQIEFLTTAYRLWGILVFMPNSKGERNVIITIYNNNKTVRAFACCI